MMRLSQTSAVGLGSELGIPQAAADLLREHIESVFGGIYSEAASQKLNKINLVGVAQNIVNLLAEEYSIIAPKVYINNNPDWFGGYSFGRNRIAINSNLLMQADNDINVVTLLNTLSHEMTHAYLWSLDRRYVARQLEVGSVEETLAVAAILDMSTPRSSIVPDDYRRYMLEWHETFAFFVGDLVEDQAINRINKASEDPLIVSRSFIDGVPVRTTKRKSEVGS